VIRLQALLGVAGFLLVAWGASDRRSAVRWRRVGGAAALQALLTVALLRLPGVADLLLALNSVVVLLEEATASGAQFVFGYLAGAPAPFPETDTGSSFIVFFRVLPLIVVLSALSAVGFHLGVLRAAVRLLAAGLQRTLGLSGPLGFGAASSVFFGIVESPLLIGPYLAGLSRAELVALLTCGMATVAGTVMVLYASVIGPVLPGALGHIVVASLISVPAALAMAELLCPGDIEATDVVQVSRPDATAVGALLRGTREGTAMVVDIAATILVLFACVHLVNAGLGLLPGDPTLQSLVGAALTPALWGCGLTWEEARFAGPLMGTKTVLNEFVAYLQLAESGGGPLNERSTVTLVYALCGFANLGSVGIVVGGLGSLVPERRGELPALAARALVGGTLATLSTAAMVTLLG